jgi:hypothetical protein
MANTYTLISSYTATGSVSSINFTSIPTTYTDLLVKLSARSSNATQYVDVWLRFNGSASGYLERMVYGIGSGSALSAATSSTQINWGAADASTSTSNTFGLMDIYISNYAGPVNKSGVLSQVTETNASSAYMGIDAFLWQNTSAINAIALTSSVGSFVQYSTAYLYGIKNS